MHAKCIATGNINRVTKNIYWSTHTRHRHFSLFITFFKAIKAIKTLPLIVLLSIPILFFDETGIHPFVQCKLDCICIKMVYLPLQLFRINAHYDVQIGQVIFASFVQSSALLKNLGSYLL
jgi:hypothetical protein